MKYFIEIIKKNRTLILGYICSGIFIAFLNNSQASYFQVIIDRFTSGDLKIGTIVLYAAILITLCIIEYVDEYPGRTLEHGIYLDFKLKALSKISRIDYLAYQSLGTGKLVQKIENGAEAGKGILFDYIFFIFRELVPSILFSMLFIYRINKGIMLTILCGYGVVFIITNLLLKALYRIKEHILSNEEMLNHFLVRGFMEMLIFRINKRFDAEIKKAKHARNEIVSAKVKMTLIHEAFFASFALLITFVKIAIIVYGFKTNAISIGAIVALLTLVNNAYTPIAIFNVLYVQYKLDKTAFERYTKFLEEDEDGQLFDGTVLHRVRGKIECHDLAFSYGNREILTKLSLTITQGETLAVVGESGSGKSTLIKLLLGLLKPSAGQINIDGQELSKINLSSYYSYVSYISQEAPVFDGTLRENLVFDAEIADDEIIEVLKKVHLFELYETLESGLDTEIGERGIILSGGERQRLALARLWFKPSGIVILDEATSAMDNITEELVIKNVMQLLSDQTVIVIAHRLNTIQNLKRILVFKEGKIVGDGAMKELLLQNAYFKELYEANIR